MSTTNKELMIPTIGTVPSANIDKVPINEEDKVIYTSDTGEQFVDINGVRTKISDVKVCDYTGVDTLLSALTDKDDKKLLIAYHALLVGAAESFVYNHKDDLDSDAIFNVFQLVPIKKSNYIGISKTISQSQDYNTFIPVVLALNSEKAEVLLDVSTDSDSYILKFNNDKCISDKALPENFHIYKSDKGVFLCVNPGSSTSGVSAKLISETDSCTYFVDKHWSETNAPDLSTYTEVTVEVTTNLPTVEDVVGPKVLACGTAIIQPFFDSGAWDPLTVELCTIPVKFAGSNTVEISNYIRNLCITATARASCGYGDRPKATPNYISNVIIPVIITNSNPANDSVTFYGTIDLPTIDSFTEEALDLAISISYMVVEKEKLGSNSLVQ